MSDDIFDFPLPSTDAAPPKKVVDAQKRFGEMSKAAAPVADAVAAFLTSKQLIAQTHPALKSAERKAAAGGIAERGLPLTDKNKLPPIPGGVGYGMFFLEPFRSSWTTGTAISWDIVCPTIPGGNVNNWLYLTAMNRASKGCEAFVSYMGQNDTRFKVFDWSRPVGSEFALQLPFASIPANLKPVTSHGNATQVMSVMNTTYQFAPNRWRNDVMLLNFTTNQWELTYRSEYDATIGIQLTGFPGTWGPIVETFQNAYSGTAAFGALNTKLNSCDQNGQWRTWQHLAPSQSEIRDDNKGFDLMFLDSNFSWTINS